MKIKNTCGSDEIYDATIANKWICLKKLVTYKIKTNLCEPDFMQIIPVVDLGLCNRSIVRRRSGGGGLVPSRVLVVRLIGWLFHIQIAANTLPDAGIH